MRLLSTLTIAAFLLLPAQAQAPKKYGDGVSLADTTPLARLLDRPTEFEGKTVKVEGTVTAVCAHMGCWMALAVDDKSESRTVMIKVDDGGPIVFPVSAKGHRAVAQGVIQRVGSDAEAREAAAEHAGRPGAAAAEAPTNWQLKATGALVY